MLVFYPTVGWVDREKEEAVLPVHGFAYNGDSSQQRLQSRVLGALATTLRIHRLPDLSGGNGGVASLASASVTSGSVSGSGTGGGGVAVSGIVGTGGSGEGAVGGVTNTLAKEQKARLLQRTQPFLVTSIRGFSTSISISPSLNPTINKKKKRQKRNVGIPLKKLSTSDTAVHSSAASLPSSTNNDNVRSSLSASAHVGTVTSRPSVPPVSIPLVDPSTTTSSSSSSSNSSSAQSASSSVSTSALKVPPIPLLPLLAKDQPLGARLNASESSVATSFAFSLSSPSEDDIDLLTKESPDENNWSLPPSDAGGYLHAEIRVSLRLLASLGYDIPGYDPPETDDQSSSTRTTRSQSASSASATYIASRNSNNISNHESLDGSASEEVNGWKRGIVHDNHNSNNSGGISNITMTDRRSDPGSTPRYNSKHMSVELPRKVVKKRLKRQNSDEISQSPSPLGTAASTVRGGSGSSGKAGSRKSTSFKEAALLLKSLDRATWISYSSLHRNSGAEESATLVAGEVMLLEQEGISVVSDIDDTVKVSLVLDMASYLRNTFLRAFKVVPGMASLYRSWEQELDARFHWVSGSPYQLWEELDTFLREQNFPKGSYHLRKFKVADKKHFRRSGTGRSLKRERKRYHIEPLLRRFPNRKFIFVGDTGEEDPEIYVELAKEYPKQVKAIFIRRAPEKTDRRTLTRDLRRALMSKEQQQTTTSLKSSTTTVSSEEPLATTVVNEISNSSGNVALDVRPVSRKAAASSTMTPMRMSMRGKNELVVGNLEDPEQHSGMEENWEAFSVALSTSFEALPEWLDAAEEEEEFNKNDSAEDNVLLLNGSDEKFKLKEKQEDEEEEEENTVETKINNMTLSAETSLRDENGRLVNSEKSLSSSSSSTRNSAVLSSSMSIDEPASVTSTFASPPSSPTLDRRPQRIKKKLRSVSQSTPMKFLPWRRKKLTSKTGAGEGGGGGSVSTSDAEVSEEELQIAAEVATSLPGHRRELSLPTEVSTSSSSTVALRKNKNGNGTRERRALSLRDMDQFFTKQEKDARKKAESSGGGGGGGGGGDGGGGDGDDATDMGLLLGSFDETLMKKRKEMIAAAAKETKETWKEKERELVVIGRHEREARRWKDLGVDQLVEQGLVWHVFDDPIELHQYDMKKIMMVGGDGKKKKVVKKAKKKGKETKKSKREGKTKKRGVVANV